jgi:glycerol-3-phosphate acyltransferase PlsY
MLELFDPVSWRFGWPYFLVALAFGYLVGSIPFGVILTRLTGAGDLRQIGSGNIGATNVLRTGRKGLAAATLLGDMLKGTVAVLVAAIYGPMTALLAGLGAFLGHLVPVWLRFKGGKGVATYLGVLIGLAWPGALAFAGIWLLVAFLTRYSSLAALVAAVLTPVILWIFGFRAESQLFAILSAVLIFKHHENMRRLIAGTESKIDLGSKG